MPPQDRETLIAGMENTRKRLEKTWPSSLCDPECEGRCQVCPDTWARELMGVAVGALDACLAYLRAERVSAFKEHVAAHALERLALCPDHRDKGTGDRCIVCKFEASARREAREDLRSERTPPEPPYLLVGWSTILCDAVETLQQRGHEAHVRRAAVETIKSIQQGIQRYAESSPSPAREEYIARLRESTARLAARNTGIEVNPANADAARGARTPEPVMTQAEIQGTVRDVVRAWLQSRIDYHDRNESEAEAMDCAVPAKFHREQRLALQRELEAAHVAAPAAPTGSALRPGVDVDIDGQPWSAEGERKMRAQDAERAPTGEE